MAWILLILGGFCEIGFTTCLQTSDNLTNWSKNWLWATGFFVFLFLEFQRLKEDEQQRLSLDGTCKHGEYQRPADTSWTCAGRSAGRTQQGCNYANALADRK